MKRDAFTMVEIVMVIVIFGIISTIGANIIAKMYANYMQSRTVNYLQSQSEIALEQIAKRLQYRIKDSTVARKTTTNTIRRLSSTEVDDTFSVIEWIGYSNEAMLTTGAPGWSGFIDLDSADTYSPYLVTPGSDLTSAVNIMKALSNNEVNLTDGGEAALIFKDKKGNEPEVGYGWDGLGGTADYMLKVKRKDGTTFEITGSSPGYIHEHYYLAHSAYALVPIKKSSDVDFDLELRYNYQPWLGENYEDNAKRALLATNVSLFRAKQVGNTIRLKLCLHDNKLSGFENYVAACKEEVVL
ncbi:MAG: type II secretion system GspH family protein [Campylobacteraceae bacterium]|jgi:prepilin-type N-terminal cleavage/methylation domain-containing protein|nr:type II secretion system GspH family protein [Campylobacteraceae bacterium]